MLLSAPTIWHKACMSASATVLYVVISFILAKAAMVEFLINMSKCHNSNMVH